METVWTQAFQYFWPFWSNNSELSEEHSPQTPTYASPTNCLPSSPLVEWRSHSLERSKPIQLFSTNLTIQKSTGNESFGTWDGAIVCDWREPLNDLHGMSLATAKEGNLSFILMMLRLGEGRALFFCSSSNEAGRVAAVGSVKAGEIIYLNRWHSSINVLTWQLSK